MIINKQIKGILFDKDGTIIEFENHWHGIYKEVFEVLSDKLGIPQDDIAHLKQLSGYLSTGFDKESMLQFKSTSEIIDIWCNYLTCDVANRKALKVRILDIIEKVSQDEKHVAKTMVGATDVLKHLKAQGYILGIATADTERSMIKSLSNCQLLEYFDFLGCDDGITRPKPHPDLGVAFTNHTGLKLDEFCVVGDSVSDYEFANQCCAPFIGIASSYSSLREHLNPNRCIKSLSELIETLNDIQKS